MGPFVPLCPSCRYDLSGLPDGACPECGARFELLALAREWADRGRAVPAWRRAGAAMAGSLLLVVPASVLSLSGRMLGNGGVQAAAVLQALVWGLAALWAVRARAQGRPSLDGVWLAVPLAFCAVAPLAGDGPSPARIGVLALAGGMAWAIGATARRRDVWRGAAARGAGVTLLGAGVLGGAVACVWFSRGWHWSQWPEMTVRDTERPACPAATTMDTLVASAALAAVGAAALAVSFIPARSGATARSRSPGDSA
jgi:hypothetical protein